ncbi:MAG: RNA 2',3'-cyclic phosphodiesterase [Nanoarchaeota archaeon]|nr:RNA 2',3'-cyclic phosphodiesterase [Nanoarchaeota archaeon]
MRLFIAIELDSCGDFFRGIQDKIDSSSLKLIFTKNYHLTLKFLGEIGEKEIEKIKERLARVKFEAFELCADRIGFFPNEKYIKVIWIGIENNQRVRDLQQSIDKCLSDIFSKEKNFHPHITLARVKFVRDKEELKKNVLDIDIGKKHFKVNGFKLIKSILTPGGPVYENLEEFEA